MIASFCARRWTARVVLPVRVTPLWPASWVSAVDKTRNSKSLEVRDIWDIYDHVLQFVPVDDAWAIDDALVDRDVHLAWTNWSSAAERALVDAFQRSGGPVPIQGLSLGRGKACLCAVCVWQ